MPQIIPLVVTAITAVTSAVVAAGPLAVAAFNAANVIGAAALANEAFKAVQPQVKSSSTAIEWNADPNAPNRFAFGRVGGAGNIIHNATYGPDKMFVGFVGVMSASGPIKSWQAFKADDAFVAFEAGKAINTEYANEMYLGVQRGLQPELSYLPSPAGLKNGAAMPRWGASYKLSGKAAYMYTLAENSKRSAYKGKVPTGIHYIEGLYCYDPRFDSTYPGGTGPCRIDDPTTWVYSTNAYIHALNWNIGRWEGEARGFSPARYGVPYASMKVGGIGATPEGIDFSGYVEAANVFDENAWACAAWPDADQSKAAVLDSFLQAGGGIYAERQGKISCLHRAAPRTSVVTITADDTAGTIEYDTTTSLLERINTIRPEYWSEAHGWQMVATDEVTASVWREEDGQGVAVTRSKGLAYNYVPQSKQARELAALQIAHTREGIRGTAPLRHYLDLEVGDCFTFEVPEAVLNGQKCIVLNVDPDLENDIIHVTFASESDGKYPFAFGQADAPPPAPALQPADNTVSPPLPGDWTITPRPPAPGGQLPVIDLSGIVSNATADAMLINWREVVTGEDPDAQPPFMDEQGDLLPGWVDAGVWPPTTRTLSIQGPQPGAQIWIAIRYKRGNNVSPAELAGPITVGDLIAGGLSPDSPDWDTIRGEAGDMIAEAEARQAAALATAKSQLQAADAATNAALSSADTRLTGGLNALSAALDDLSLEDLDGFLAFSTSIQTALDGKATNGQLSGLATRVTTAEGTLTAQNTRLNTVETGLAGKAGATDLANLTTRVTSAEGVNAAQNTRLNTVEADVAGKASASALTELSASVAVRNRTFYTATEPTNPYRGYPLVTCDEWINTSANNERKLWSGTQNQWLNSHDPRIASTAGQVVTLDAKVTGHQTAISDLQTGKASASDLVALTTRVTTAEGVNTAQNSRLNTVESSLDGKASATEVNTLKSEVTAARNGSPSLHAQLTGMRQVSSDLQSGKANASDLTNLTTRVTSAEGVNAAQNTRLNTVEADVAGKASASSVTDLSASVAVRNRTFYTATEPTNPYRGYPLVTCDEWINTSANNERKIWSGTQNQWLNSHDPRIASTAGQVVTLDAKVTGHQTAISDLQTGKASASDLIALTTRVTTAEGVNTAQNTRLNTVETSLDGKASATALTTLSSRVGTAESTLTTVAQTAADASGKANAIVGHVLDVNGYISGTKSENDGVRSTYEILADSFSVRATGTAARTEFINGIWYAYDAANAVRSSWGRPHGASNHGLTWWTGPNSVAKGSETKSNAYVYVSMNTTGGPRFGGTDVPTGGNTVIEGPVIRGQSRTFNSSNMTGGNWVSAGTVTLTEVPAGSNLSFQLVSLSGDISPGTTFSGEARILDGGSVVASTAFTLFPEVPGGPLTISGGLAVANVSGSGSKTYTVEVRNTGVASLNYPSGQWSLTTSTVATSSQAGMMSPQQAQQLADLWASGGGGGVALATTAPASVGVNNAVGTGTTAARADHVHAHGNQAGGALHALATTSAHGFMPSTDKVKLNSIATGATANSTENAHASTGTLLLRDPSSGAARASVFAANTGGSTVGGFTIGGRSLYANGDDLAFNRAVSGPAFTPTSDPDLKENIQPVSDDLAALVQVLSAGQIEYDRTQDGAHALGFNAKALRDINPLWTVGGEPLDPSSPPDDLDLIIVDEDGETLRFPLAVDPMALISSLFAALRQNANDIGYTEMRLLQVLNRVDALEAEMAALKAA